MKSPDVLAISGAADCEALHLHAREAAHAGEVEQRQRSGLSAVRLAVVRVACLVFVLTAVMAVAMVAAALTAPVAIAIVAYSPPITPADVEKMRAKAAAGDKYAQSHLGSWYEYGSNGLPLDLEEAANWYRRAAEQEHESSQRRLAEMYEFGEGVPASHAEALHWMGRAIKNYSGASTLIAGRYRAGIKAPKDFRKAAEWCRLSAEAGDVSAQDMLGELYEFGPEIQDYGEAARWYRRAAMAETAWREPGKGAAMASLGRLYMNGNGVPLDYGLAAEWFRRGVESGNFQASYGLGLLYERGTGVPRDLKRAMELYYDVAPIHREARDRLFMLYEQKFPVPADDALAIAQLREKAEAGNAWAQAALGLRYKFGRGVRRDWSIAYALFNLAARSRKSADAIPDFTGPEVAARAHMDARAWQLVSEMQRPGELRAAIARFESEAASRP